MKNMAFSAFLSIAPEAQDTAKDLQYHEEKKVAGYTPMVTSVNSKHHVHIQQCYCIGYLGQVNGLFENCQQPEDRYLTPAIRPVVIGFPTIIRVEIRLKSRYT